MSLYAIAVNKTKREYLCPGDLGTNIDDRSVLNNAHVFHLAVVRLLEDRWHGDSVALAVEGCGPNTHLWETALDEYKNIAEEVIEDLLTKRALMSAGIFGASVAELEKHLAKLKERQAEELAENEDES